TVHALSQLAAIATFAGDADAGDLIESAFDLAQALDLGDTVFAALFVMRGIHETTTGDYRESVADLREAARLSQLAGDHLGSGRALGNLADVLLAVDPAGSADAARQALAHLRRAGGRRLTYAVVINLIQALILVGSWREAEAVLADAATEGLASRSILAWVIVLLTALRDGTSSEALASVELFATSEDPQDLASVSISHALASWAEGDMRGAFESARETLAHAGALGLSSEYVRWGWPLAAEAALRLGNRPEVNRLLDWLDGHPEGQIPRVLRAERLRIRARLEASGADGTAGARFEEAVAAFRELGSPYHLAVGLLDRAEYCSSIGEHELARELAAEAEEIAGELASRPLVRRASALLRGQETASAPEEAAVGRS
ncbi:MAG TPA: hypothetical protein VK217_00585, partial [Acidimicrobiales bacterium]|nr:hypothetical protein [Acidimicrobiales bacterium]